MPKIINRKMWTVRFKDRQPRALLWEKRVYRTWFRFAQEAKKLGKKVPKEFGPIESMEFEDWWRHPKYGFELFCEPYYGDLVKKVDGRGRKKPNTVRLEVVVGAQDTDILVRDFKRAIRDINEHAEFESNARFQPSKPLRYIYTKKLEAMLDAYILSESMVHRRAVRRIFLDREQKETPHFKRNKQGRLEYDADKSVYYEYWHENKIRLLSFQRKKVREIFANIEEGIFP